MERKPIALILEKAIADLDRVIEITETLIQDYRQARLKLQRELTDLTPTEATEAFRRASEQFRKP